MPNYCNQVDREYRGFADSSLLTSAPISKIIILASRENTLTRPVSSHFCMSGTKPSPISETRRFSKRIYLSFRAAFNHSIILAYGQLGKALICKASTLIGPCKPAKWTNLSHRYFGTDGRQDRLSVRTS